MRILMITTTLPHHLTNGGEIATSNLIEGMERCGHRVEVLGYNRLGDPPSQRPNFHAACDWVIETELAGLRKWKWLAESLVSGLPYVCVKFRTAAMRKAARALCRAHDFDAVIIDHLQLGWIADADFLPARKIGVAHNVEHRILEVQAAEPTNNALKRMIFSRDARLMKTVERRLARSLTQLWTLTEEERASLGALARRAVLETGGDGLRVIALPGRGFIPSPTLPEPDIDVVILGSWLWEVNRKGLSWFMAEVAPLLPPDMRVVVGGKGSDQVPNMTANISYAGFVPDAADFLRRGKAICIPSIMGAGIQLKTIEGIGIGRPVVTTKVGLRGILDAPAYVSIAADAGHMAETLTSLVNAPAQNHVEEARLWTAQRQQNFDRQIAEALSSLVEGKSG